VRNWPHPFYLTLVVLAQAAHYGAREHLCAPRCPWLLPLAGRKDSAACEATLRFEWEKAVPGTGKVYMDLDETTSRIMVWADAPGDPPAPVMEAPGIEIRVVDGQLLVMAVTQGGG
jgi:hypothetical protein